MTSESQQLHLQVDSSASSVGQGERWDLSPKVGRRKNAGTSNRCPRFLEGQQAKVTRESGEIVPYVTASTGL